MPRKKSTNNDDKKDALLFAATLVADELQQEKAVEKFIEHVSELEAAKMIQHVYKIEADTPDNKKTESTTDKLLIFLGSEPKKSPQPSPRLRPDGPPAAPLLDKGAKKKKPKNN